MALLALFLLASIGQASGQDMSCRYTVREEQRTTRTLEDGFLVTVRRKANPDLTRDACVVEVRDRSGLVLFAREGYNTSLHRESGRDVDNDGHPDLVIGLDSSARNRCCREYTIVSLRPALHVAGTFSNPSFEIDLSRRTVVWSILPFADLGPATTQPPSIVIAEQYRDGRLVDITPDYCAVILAGTAKGLSSLADDLWQLEGSRRAASRIETGPPSFEAETTRVSATTVALQMTYCGRSEDARGLIRDVWPAADQEKIRASIDAAIAAVRRR